jgi:hypothetical protein
MVTPVLDNECLDELKRHSKKYDVEPSVHRIATAGTQLNEHLNLKNHCSGLATCD